MCGLLAILAANTIHCIKPALESLQSIRHRGPNDEGLVVFSESDMPVIKNTVDTQQAALLHLPEGVTIESVHESPANVILGHRRLSIVDLSAQGHQPMFSPDGRYSIIFNGEIYNYIELKSELKTHGYEFCSETDTEVLLTAYRHWGQACLPRLNGMFSFVIYDRLAKKVFIARDRFGVKPCYYWRSPAGFWAFASEIKQFTVLPGWQAKLNAQRAYDYLNWSLSDHGTETLFKGVYPLPAGHCCTMSLDDLYAAHLPLMCWYQLGGDQHQLSMDEASQQFHALFTDAVSLRLRSDVPVGTGLSGGLDSSSIVCMADSLRTSGVHHTFSSCSHIAEFDEREYIQHVVDQTATQPHYTFPDLDQLLDKNELITWHQDEPVHTTSVLAEWHLYELVAKTGVKVTLDGHGADESLAGYHAFLSVKLARLLRQGRLMEWFSEASAIQAMHGYSALSLLMQAMNRLLPEVVRQPLRAMANKEAASAAWFNSQALAVTEGDPYQQLGVKTSSIQQLSAVQLQASSLPVQLHWCDRDSMAHSVESRAPFLDYRLVDFIYSCPDSMKLYRGETKRLLRQALQTVLPTAIAKRRNKMGFVTAESAWITAQSSRFLTRIDQAIAQSKEVINSQAVSAVKPIIEGRQPYHSLPWRMISFGQWMETFEVSV